ncbi:MAG: DUF2442 domain-containing protein [Gemmatimonadaceae bacterium]|nr:DUF2442 domain-containing protein [Gemmatimonadaceae bacterium]
MHDYVLWLRFNDGVEGEVDLGHELTGEMFAPLRDQQVFARVSVHPELRTVTWPNGADFAPEFLHSRIRVSSRGHR